MDTTLLLIILIVVILAVGALLFVQLKNLRTTPETDDKSLLLIQQQLNQVTEQLRQQSVELNTRLEKSSENMTKHMQEQLKTSAGIIREVTEKLTKLDDTNKQVVGFAEQMKSLENILKNPKQRGVLGEYFLESLLSNVLPPNQFKLQYAFPNGEIVDAVIFFNDKIIPIDSKFSLEKYNLIMQETDKDRREKLEKEFKMDVKKRIDETAKYIRPSEDTTEFAFMFIPAEGIYYNLLIYNVGTVEINTQDLIEYAFSKHVIIVSPTSFYAYLETVLQGLKALKMEKSVKEIIKKIADLGRHLGSYETFLQKLGKNLDTTVGMYNSAYKEFGKIDKDIYRITGESGEPEILQLDKPNVDE
jgi:DNA recombination protein RmuC